MKLSWMPGLLVGLGAVAALAGGIRSAAAPTAPALRAGAAAVKITPSLTRPVYIAGYENNRLAESVHDDLWARALVLDDGKTRMAVVSCDLVGLTNQRVRKFRDRIRSVPKENVLIACTHVHSGPDTMGLWGRNFAVSGIDPLYMERLADRIAAAVDAGAAALERASVSAAAREVPDGLVHNSREPLQDKQLTSVRITAADGRTISTLIHYGGHPEVNKSKALTSDYVGYVRDAVEKQFGGVAIYLNGALGGMVTPKVSGHTLAEMERVGVGVGRSAVETTAAAQPVAAATVRVQRRDVKIPLENNGFKILLGAKVLDGETSDGAIPTEVWRVDLGPLTWLTIPGEILPKPALALKARMPGKYPIIIALGNDELGYILDPEDFEKKRYSYEKSMSVGKETWPRLLEAATDLLKQ
ncbi:MAG: neutral/alkaline non-lysosomal ceramidase N-terminal domain-containing protein [Actinomycetota bacterium]